MFHRHPPRPPDDPLSEMAHLARQLRSQAVQVESLAVRLDAMLYGKISDLDTIAGILRVQSEAVERVARNLDVWMARFREEGDR